MKKLLLILLLVPFASFCQPTKLLGNSFDSTKYVVADLQKYLVFKLDSEQVGGNSHYWTYKQTPKKIMNLTGDSIEVQQPELCGVKISYSGKKELRGTELVSIPATVKSIFIFGPSERIDQIFKDYLRPVFLLGTKFSEDGQWLKSDNIMAVWANDDPNKEVPLKNISIQFN
jgi:hypothetical protein